MGVCTSRDRVPHIEGAHLAENYCYAADCMLKLQSVEFRSFQAAVKRFGYRIDMNEQHLNSISAEINLDVAKLQSDEKSAYAIYYKDSEFTYVENRFQVESLVLIGWLLCRHWNDEYQARELWHIVNPTFDELADKTMVLNVANKLVHIAVDLNKRVI